MSSTCFSGLVPISRASTFTVFTIIQQPILFLDCVLPLPAGKMTFWILFVLLFALWSICSWKKLWETFRFYTHQMIGKIAGVFLISHLLLSFTSYKDAKYQKYLVPKPCWHDLAWKFLKLCWNITCTDTQANSACGWSSADMGNEVCVNGRGWCRENKFTWEIEGIEFSFVLVISWKYQTIQLIQ